MLGAKAGSVLARNRIEYGKFALYLAVPASLYCYVAYYPTGLDYWVKKFGYVVYPPEGPRPPIGEEFSELVRRNKLAKEARKARESQ